MPPSDNKKDDVDQAVARYDAELNEAEGRLQADAKQFETSFYNRTAGAEAKLERTEDRLEVEARKVDSRGAKLEAEADARIAHAREKVAPSADERK